MSFHDSFPEKQLIGFLSHGWTGSCVSCIPSLTGHVSWSLPGVLQDKDLFSVFADPSMLDT